MQYQKGSFTIVPNKESLRGMDPQSQVLFMWLCSYADERGVCFPGKERLAKDCGMSKRTVDSRVVLLTQKGLIQKKPRQNEKGDQESNKYRIMLV